jgi:hypothetical protein
MLYRGGRQISGTLADEIINISPKEMQMRYAACLRAYMDVYAKHRRKLSREVMSCAYDPLSADHIEL